VPPDQLRDRRSVSRDVVANAARPIAPSGQTSNHATSSASQSFSRNGK
jgi:hypothetical protein